MEIVIQTKNLNKYYDDNLVLNRTNLKIKKGEIVGLLGSNGAGKTTLLKLLAGLLKPTEGSVSVFSHCPWNERDKILKRLGLIIETPVFYEHLSAHQNLKLHLDYLNKSSDIEELLDSVGLMNVGDKPVSKFSMGMKQRLAIARAISHNPDILLLDEPINGLDPIAIRDMRNLFLNLRKNGITIIISSHILSEILQTTESIMVISNHGLECLGLVKDIQEKYGNETEDFLIERMRG